MRTRISLSALTATAALAFAPAAFAGDMKSDKAPKAKMTATYTTQTSDQARIIKMRAEADSEVRGALIRGDMIAVEGPNGETYINKLIPVSELPDPTLNVRTLDTVTFTHNGRTYTNRIVSE